METECCVFQGRRGKYGLRYDDLSSLVIDAEGQMVRFVENFEIVQ